MEKKRKKHIVSCVVSDNKIIETIRNEDEEKNYLLVSEKVEGKINHKTFSSYIYNNTVYLPYKYDNPLFSDRVILLPSGADDGLSKEQLISEVRKFIHCYVDVPPIYENICVYYVLMSWVFDCFNEIPYLRLRGDFGSGKTRFLQTIGSICYRGIFASGASSISPIFHILDSIGGTLLFDEADFRFSDEKSDITKMLNNGNAKGLSLLRSKAVKDGQFEPYSFKIFAPKILTTRKNYSDDALESRLITLNTAGRSVREDIPSTLPKSFGKQALSLRNKLLAFRLNNFHQIVPQALPSDTALDSRIKQIMLPLYTLACSEHKKDILNLSQRLSEELLLKRSLDTPALVASCIKTLAERSNAPIRIKDITNDFFLRYGDEYEKKITNKWIGSVVRNDLNLRTCKINGVYQLKDGQVKKIIGLEKYK